MSELIGRWQAWFIETLEGNGANFITAERDGENWNFRRFTRDPQAATIAQLQAELAEAREVLARINSTPLGTRVRKASGPQWEGVVVGHYRSSFTDDGLVIECTVEGAKGQVHVEPAKRMEVVSG